MNEEENKPEVAPETPTETDTVVVNVIDREEEVLDPNMDMVQKVGIMARICYRNEVKEGEDEKATTERIIRKCISEGHESVLEHAVMSLYLPVQECHDSMHILEKLTGLKNAPTRIPFRGIWEANGSESQVRCIMPFQDPHLHAKRVAAQNLLVNDEVKNQIVPCLVGNVRSWRNVLNEKLMIITQIVDDPLQLAVYMRILQAFYKAAPIFFEDIYNRVNDSILRVTVEEEKHGGQKTRCYTNLIAKVPAEKRSVDGIVEHFFDTPYDIYADQASPVTSFSVILTTDRATTHQLVRHRKDVAYSQESQRYVNYDKKGYNVIALTVEPSKQWNSRKLIENYDLGTVKKTTKVYCEWLDAIQVSFERYHRLLKVQEFGDMGDGKSEVIPLTLPVETVRGVLPNDTATKIGITWMLPGGFSNLMHFRADAHAQYAIRSTLDRVLLTALDMDHPYFYNFDPNELKKRLSQIKEQKIIEDEVKLDNLGTKQDDRIRAIIEYNKARAKMEEDLRKKAEEEAAKAAIAAKVPTPEDKEDVGPTTPPEEIPPEALPPAEEETPPPKVVVVGKMGPAEDATPPETVPCTPPSVSFEKPAAGDNAAQ